MEINADKMIHAAKPLAGRFNEKYEQFLKSFSHYHFIVIGASEINKNANILL